MSEEVRAFEEARNVCRLGLLDSFGLKRESVYKLMCCYLSSFSCTGVLYGACAWMCFFRVVFLLFVFIHMHFITRSQKKWTHVTPVLLTSQSDSRNEIRKEKNTKKKPTKYLKRLETRDNVVGTTQPQRVIYNIYFLWVCPICWHIFL